MGVYQGGIVPRSVGSGGLHETGGLVNAGRGFRLFVGRERHLRWYARLSVSRGSVTTAPIPRRVIASGLVKRDVFSPRVNPSCNIRGSVDVGLKRRNVAVVVRASELGLGVPPTDTVARVARLRGLRRIHVLDWDAVLRRLVLDAPL